jgi:molybdenum cofactor cytidylyltransferase
MMIAAVVLAAGSSQRMGKHKLLIQLGGKTVIERAVDNVLNSIADEVIVVTGFNASQVRKVLAQGGRESALESGRLKLIHNPFYQKGQSTSLLAGLREAGEHVEAVLFSLGDQPFVTPETINKLIRIYRTRAPKPLVVYPEFQGHRGNPVLFSMEMRARLRQIKGDEGGRSLLEYAKQRAFAVQTDCRGVIFDLDKPEDIAEARKYWDVRVTENGGGNLCD